MPVRRICKTCGKEFFVSPSDLKHGANYCCRHCGYISPERNAKLSQSIKQAWQEPDKRAAMLTGIEGRSDNPAWRNAAHFQKGPAHPKYLGNKRARLTEVGRYQYKLWRIAVLKKDDYTCQACGVRGGRLIAHHKEPWAKHPELRYDVGNGISLCPACHDKAHNRVQKPLSRTCPQCGKSFPLARSRQRFCSHACYIASKRNGTTTPCPTCGSPVYRTPSQRKTGQYHFCSNSCREAWYRNAA